MNHQNRIRYKKHGNKFVSIQIFSHETNGANYQIVIQLPDWAIMEVGCGMVAMHGMNDLLHEAQFAARNALVDLGIKLTTEKRSKRRY